MAWLSSNSLSPTDSLHADQLNSLANDIRNWGGDVNGGGHHLSNVIIDGYAPPGGGVALNSPAQVIPWGGQPTAVMWFDSTDTGGNSTPRWSIGKDGTSETGANAGANFAITRWSDTGIPLATPFAIRRSDGLVTMGAQQWTGPINGGGQTISNVVITGVMQDPTTTKGDLIVHGSATTRLPVGADGFILIADSTQALGVKWAAAPATGVPTTRKINTGTGLTGGGDLSADRTLSIVADSVNQQVQVSLGGGAVIGTRHQINLIQGAGTTLTVADNAGSNRVDVTVAAAGSPLAVWVNSALVGTRATLNLIAGTGTIISGIDNSGAGRVDVTITATGSGGGQPQTPWASDINAAGFRLLNSGFHGIGVNPPTHPIHIVRADTGLYGVWEQNTNATAAGGFAFNNDQGDFVNLIMVGSQFATTTLQRMASLGCNRDFQITSNGVVKVRMTTAAIVIGGSLGTATAPINASSAISVRGVTEFNSPGYPDTNASGFAYLYFVDSFNSTNPIRACINTILNGSTAGGKGADMVFYTAPETGAIVERIRLTSGGSVGVGTASPLATLHVKAGVNQNIQIGSMAWALAGAAGFNAANDANTGAVPMVFAASLHQFLGNVGMGRTPSTYALEVAGDAYITGTYRVNAGTISSYVSSIFLNANYQVAAAGQGLDWQVNGSGFKEMRVLGCLNAGGSMGELAFYTNQNVVAANGTEKMRITGTGRVGIGITAPNYPLDVIGDVNVTGAFRVNGVPLATGGAMFTNVNAAPGRVIGTVYQNTTGKVMMVIVTATSGSATLYATCDASAAPTTVLASVATSTAMTLIFLVQPGYYYKLNQSGGTAGLNTWVEYF